MPTIFITKQGIRIPIKIPPSKDNYYISEKNGLFELRQNRFHDRLLKNQTEHPHDVIALNTSRVGLLKMRKMLQKSK